MKKNELQNKNEVELRALIQERQEALRQQRFAIAGSKGRDVKKMREDRKNIARALTELHSR